MAFFTVGIVFSLSLSSTLFCSLWFFQPCSSVHGQTHFLVRFDISKTTVNNIFTRDTLSCFFFLPMDLIKNMALLEIIFRVLIEFLVTDTCLFTGVYSYSISL